LLLYVLVHAKATSAAQLITKPIKLKKLFKLTLFVKKIDPCDEHGFLYLIEELKKSG